MTLNFLRQAKFKPEMSAYKYMEGPFNYDVTPLVLLGCSIIIHKKSSQRHN